MSIPFPWIRCDNWIGDPIKPVTPAHIAQSITDVLSKGWDPAGGDLEAYRRALEKRWARALELRAWAVVALGFERLVARRL